MPCSVSDDGTGTTDQEAWIMPLTELHPNVGTGSQPHGVAYASCNLADLLAGAGVALRCWLCGASADVMMGRVYGAVLVAVLVGR